jgi:hypothetical protein
MIVDSDFTFERIGGYPRDVCLGLGTVRRNVQTTCQGYDLSIFDLMRITNEVSTVVFETNGLVGSQAIIIFTILQSEIGSINKEGRCERNGVLTHGRIRR